jgi:hypothetical protein
MKSTSYLFFSAAFVIFLVTACRKPVTKPVKFTSTTYQNLSTFNNEGKPDNLLEDTISPSLLSFINTSLPDGQNLTKSHPELFTTTANNDILITQHSDVYITFVSESSGATNAIAFYTYPTNQPPQSAKDIEVITYVFPNAGNSTALTPGDKVKIGTFEAGTSVGFVILKDAWDSKTAKLNNNVVHFCSDDVLNPEVDPNLKKHAVFINYSAEKKTLVGFEDTDRTDPSCDNDFNDVVFYTTVN